MTTLSAAKAVIAGLALAYFIGSLIAIAAAHAYRGFTYWRDRRRSDGDTEP